MSPPPARRFQQPLHHLQKTTVDILPGRNPAGDILAEHLLHPVQHRAVVAAEGVHHRFEHGNHIVEIIAVEGIGVGKTGKFRQVAGLFDLGVAVLQVRGLDGQLHKRTP